MRRFWLVPVFLSAWAVAPTSLRAQPRADTGTAVSSQGRDFRFAPSDASLLGSIRISRLLASPLLQAGVDAGLAGSGTSADARSTQAIQKMILGVLGEIREVRFAVVETPTALQRGVPAQPDVLMLIDGQVEEGLAALLLQGVSGKGQDALSIRRLDSTHLLMGSPGLLDRATERWNAAASVGADALASLDLLEPLEYEMWLAGRLPDLPMTAGVGAGLKNIAIGLRLQAGDNNFVDVAAETTSAAMAEALAQMAREAIASQLQAAGPAAAGMTPNSLQASLANNTVRLRLKLPKDQSLRPLQQTLGPLASTGSSPQTLLPEPRKSVRILGLRDPEGADRGSPGVHEIPLH